MIEYEPKRHSTWVVRSIVVATDVTAGVVGGVKDNVRTAVIVVSDEGWNFGLGHYRSGGIFHWKESQSDQLL